MYMYICVLFSHAVSYIYFMCLLIYLCTLCMYAKSAINIHVSQLFTSLGLFSGRWLHRQHLEKVWRLPRVPLRHLHLAEPWSNWGSCQNVQSFPTDLSRILRQGSRFQVLQYGFEEMRIWWESVKNEMMSQEIIDLGDTPGFSNTMFKSSRILRGLKFLHSQGVIHRDIKAWKLVLFFSRFVPTHQSYPRGPMSWAPRRASSSWPTLEWPPNSVRSTAPSAGW